MNQSELCRGRALHRHARIDDDRLELGMATTTSHSTQMEAASVHQQGRTRNRGRSAQRFLAFLCASVFFLLHDEASALPGVKNYPRVAQFATNLGEYTPAQLDSLSWYDLLSINASSK